jgi:hypothetical protein
MTEPGILVRIPIRTKNPLNGACGNSRLAAVIRARDRAKQRDVTLLIVVAALHARGLEGPELVPATVTFTRVSAGRLDDDGLAASLKGPRDSIAKALGVNDGDREAIRFRYAQRRGPQRKFEVEILIERRNVPC